MGSRQWASRHQLWQVDLHFHYQGNQRDRGPIESLRWCCWRERRRGGLFLTDSQLALTILSLQQHHLKLSMGPRSRWFPW